MENVESTNHCKSEVKTFGIVWRLLGRKLHSNNKRTTHREDESENKARQTKDTAGDGESEM